MDNTTILIVVVAVLLGGVGLFFFLRARNAGPKEEPYFHFNCPGCRRKLRYRARQAGHSGMCPRCNNPCVFPAVPKG